MNDAIHTNTNINQINYIVMVVPEAKKKSLSNSNVLVVLQYIYTKKYNKIKSYFNKSLSIIFE